ncbi:xanthine dehydrogenase family protein molybdopterin-binding subunit [Winogradskyella forsetii]|uniref:xanthine dehydrogenase family protein molybdopterin-binding subunit n=1 Tax=Winogradskyella forsetii TaxID=2686077 RepID=UPI0015BDE756|nr:xanthine dehydrogenase family protein molybdopterin-binding subunit [Winogradskyella forsetii]
MLDIFNIDKQQKGRIEGIAKVTGKAKYSAEYDIPNLAHGVLVGSTIASGTLVNLDIEEAKQVPGVIDVLSYWNKPKVAGLDDESKRKEAFPHHTFFHHNTIQYNDQPIALVVAETLEDATYAATLLKPEYAKNEFTVDFKTESKSFLVENTGQIRGKESLLNNADYSVEQDYTIAMEVHNPMEMHATIAQWENDGTLKLFDKSQGVNGVQGAIAGLFDMPQENIIVNSEYVGGGFGAGLRVWFNTVAAAMAAKQLQRPVKVVLTRPQMFTMVGYRPESWQRVKIGANADGKLLGINHQAKHNQSQSKSFGEGITGISRKVYAFEYLKTERARIPLHLSVPTWMRGPGDSTGTFAVESALDELCYKMDFDPVKLRLKNIAPQDMESGKPWSTHYLNECLERGAKEIGWENRPKQPKQLKDGDWYTGYGMAVGLWNAMRRGSGASIEMNSEGDIIVRTAMTDIGTGTGQAMVNMTHSFTGIPKDKIKIELGNSLHPKAVTQGGSWGLASLSGAIDAVCTALKQKLGSYAYGNSEITNMEAIKLTDMGIQTGANTDSFMSYADIFSKNALDKIYVEEYSSPGKKAEDFAFCSSAAHFYKVKVNTLTGKVKMERMVIVVDGGKIVNPKAAENQIIGAGVGGVGMALTEKQDIDFSTGRLVGNDFAGYHVPVNADMPMIEVSFIDKPDYNRNPIGAKGLGEVGLIGSAPAITNAIYNAIGKRFTSLPITPDKILVS